MDKSTTATALKNNKSGIVHMIGDDSGTVCRHGLTATTLKSGDELVNVYGADNVVEAYSKVTCKRCIGIAKHYIKYLAM